MNRIMSFVCALAVALLIVGMSFMMGSDTAPDADPQSVWYIYAAIIGVVVYGVSRGWESSGR